MLKYSGEDSRRVIVDESAPLYHIGTQKEHSPMRFIVSDNDMENRLEQTELVLSTLKHFEYVFNIPYQVLPRKITSTEHFIDVNHCPLFILS